MLAPLLIISCNANMNTNDKNKALNEYKLQNISEVIKNSLQIESDFKKELEANINKSTPPILEIEKIELGKQEFPLKSESNSEILIPLEDTNIAKSEEEIAKIQEKLLLIGAPDEIAEQELDPNKKPLHLTTIEFKISSNAEEQEILNPIEEETNINIKDKIFDQKEENSTLNESTKTSTQIQFQKQSTYLSEDGNFITKEYAEQVRESLDKTLNAIKNLETSKDLEIENEIENLSKEQSSANTSNNTSANNINTENIEKTKINCLKSSKKVNLFLKRLKIL